MPLLNNFAEMEIRKVPRHNHEEYKNLMHSLVKEQFIGNGQVDFEERHFHQLETTLVDQKNNVTLQWKYQNNLNRHQKI